MMGQLSVSLKERERLKVLSRVVLKLKGISGSGKVLVRRRLDGSLHFVRNGEELEWSEPPARPAPKAKKKKRGGSGTIMEKYIPPPDHPWRN